MLFDHTIALLTHAPEAFGQPYCDAVMELVGEVAAALGYEEPSIVIYDTRVLEYLGLENPETAEEAEWVSSLLVADKYLEELGCAFKNYAEYANSVEQEEANMVYIYIYED